MLNEIRPLTGIRGIAAFFVMLYHLVIVNGEKPFWLAKGYLCVDLFFILSGFVLALRYEKKFAAGGRKKEYAAFLKSRFARIYPAYFLISLIYYAKFSLNLTNGRLHDYSAFDLLCNLLLIQGWGVDAYGLVGPSWSVSTEVLAYFLFPLLMYIAVGRGLLAAACVALISLAGILIVIQSGQGINGPLDVSQNFNAYPLLRCLAGFAMGLAAYRITQNAATHRLLSGNAATWLIMAATLAAFYWDKSDIGIFLSFTALIMCLFYNSSASAALFGNRLTEHLGNISYSLYLIHNFFNSPAHQLAQRFRQAYHIDAEYCFIAGGALASWFCAYLSYRYIEIPCRQFFRRRRSPDSTPALGVAA